MLRKINLEGKPKKDLRQIKSEQAIVDAAIQTLITYPTASMSDIATAAGVGRATLYRHYESREVLIKAIVIRCMEETDLATKPMEHLKGRAALEAIFDLLMPLADRFRFLASIWTLVEGDKDLNQIQSQMDKDIIYLIKQAKKRGDIAKALPDKWLLAFFDSTFTAAWTLVSSGDASPDEAANYAKQSFFNGCSVQKL